MGRCVNRWHQSTIGRHSLSHAHSGVPAPSEREPGRAVPLNVPPGNRNFSGDFHRPYETQKILVFTIQRTTLPQSRPFGRASSLREGAGKGCTTQRAAQKPQLFGRFSSPLRRLGRFWFLPFIGRHSLSHAHSGVPAPSEREPGEVRTIQRAAPKPQRCGRFSSPLRSSKVFTFHHSSGAGRRHTAGASARWSHTSACSWRGCPRG